MIEDEKISKEINSIMKMNTFRLSSEIMNNDPAMAIHLKKNESAMLHPNVALSPILRMFGRSI